MKRTEESENILAKFAKEKKKERNLVFRNLGVNQVKGFFESLLGS